MRPARRVAAIACWWASSGSASMSLGRHRQVARDRLGVLLAEGLQLVARRGVEVGCRDLVGHDRLVERAAGRRAALLRARLPVVPALVAAGCRPAVDGCCHPAACTTCARHRAADTDFALAIARWHTASAHRSRGGYDFRSPSRGAYGFFSPSRCADTASLTITSADTASCSPSRSDTASAHRHAAVRLSVTRAAGAIELRPCRRRCAAARAALSRAARSDRRLPCPRSSRVGCVNEKWPPSFGWPFHERSPAVSYSPTGSPLQYHRRCEA